MNLIALTPAAGDEPALFTADLAPALDLRTLLRMLEEVDYGIALVTVNGSLRFANQLALRTLGEAGAGPLRLCKGVLSAATLADQAQLRGALVDAARGLRRMLHLGEGAHAASIAVKPLLVDEAANDAEAATATAAATPRAAASALAMLVFGKRQTCETLTLDIFARTQKLTGAETGVLHGLCAGQRPKQIAAGAGVAVSTIRTQINSIRIKTHTSSIRELVDRVAALPPITPAMKSVVCH